MFGGFLINLVTGGALKTVLSGIGDWQQRKLAAQNNSERIAADKEIASLEVKASVLRAEAKDTINRWFRGFIAIGPATYIFSYFFIDKVLCVKLGLTGAVCRVDSISDDTMKWVLISVVGFYFVTETFGRRRS